MYEYQETQTYLAQVAEDVKEIAIGELAALGAGELSPTYRGIRFQASPALLYAINLRARLVSRILAPLATFNCRSSRYLYKKSREIPWEDFIDSDQTLSVNASVSHSAIKHSRYAALKLKDAVVDRFREQTGRRPSVARHNADLGLHLHLLHNRATVSLDASGGSLHRRGYRVSGGPAPLSETLGAAILTLSEWDGSVPLYDPFCGSGTLLCEGYLLASRTPPGMLRPRFGFERLPDFEPETWQRVRAQAAAGIAPPAPGLIAGSDISCEAVAGARRNAGKLAPGAIQIEREDVFRLESLEGRTIVCNPPYGIRLETGRDLSDFYRRLGDFLKQRCRGAQAYVYFGERKYLKKIGLRASWKKALSNGGLDGRLAKFELY